MSINVTHDFIRNLTKGIRVKYGADLKHTEAMDLVAAALGWKTDALMHKLKNEGRPMETADFEAPVQLDKSTMVDWFVRRQWRDIETEIEASLQNLKEEAIGSGSAIDMIAELALVKAAFGQIAEAMGILEGNSPDSPYSFMAWGIVRFMAEGESVEAGHMVMDAIARQPRLLECMAVPRKMADREFRCMPYGKVRTGDDWWRLYEFVERFPSGSAVEFVRQVAVDSGVCLARDGGEKLVLRASMGSGLVMEPAVPISESVGEDGIVCLFDGTKWLMPKRYILASYGMSEAAYRKFWNLPDSYPMVASGYKRHKEEVTPLDGTPPSPRLH